MERATAYDGSVPSPLAALALAQHGTATTGQLRGLGIGDARIARLVAAGFLIRIHLGVYAIGHPRLTVEGRWTAALHACGPGARLSHGDALALRDLRRAGSGVIHVSAPGKRRVRGVCCHVVRELGRLGDAVIDGIPATSLERALLDCAPTLSPQRLRSLLEETERRDQFDLRRFAAVLDAGRGHRGVGRLRAAIDEMADTPPSLRSDLERDFLEGVRAAGLQEPRANVIVDGESVDFHWSGPDVIAEIDSWRYHRGRRSFAEDRRRANVFALSGRTLLRFTDARIRDDLPEVIAELAAALHARGAASGAGGLQPRGRGD